MGGEGGAAGSIPGTGSGANLTPATSSGLGQQQPAGSAPNPPAQQQPLQPPPYYPFSSAAVMYPAVSAMQAAMQSAMQAGVAAQGGGMARPPGFAGRL